MYSSDGYDPVKAHEYYERTKKLKGRKAGTSKKVVSSKPQSKPSPASLKQKKAAERVGRLRGKLSKLKKALSLVEAELSQRRQAEREAKKKNSDGKTTAKERQDSKDYREKHQQEIATKEKKEAKQERKKASPASNPNDLSSMSIESLNDRATKLRSTIREAQRQLSNANQQLGQLAHSYLATDPNLNGLFAQSKSAERIPSK